MNIKANKLVTITQLRNDAEEYTRPIPHVTRYNNESRRHPNHHR